MYNNSNNAEFLSRLSSNAYEFDKREMRFHLRKSVVTLAKKKETFKVNGTFIAEELWFQQTFFFFSRKRNIIIGKLLFEGKK